MNYTLNQLQIFLKIVQKESITKAAEALHLTQPAVSIQLKNLQDQFEIPLTEVVGRKLYITSFGKEIASAAEEILNQVHAINYKTSAYRGKLTGRLKIAVVSTGKYVMPYFLSDFIRTHSDVELVMDVTNKNKVIECLENNDTDFALVSILPKHISIEQLDLLQNKLYLVANQEIKSTKKVQFDAILKKAPLIFREKGSGTRQTMEGYLDKYNFSADRKLELTSNEAVKQAVLAGLGVSIMPLIGIKNELFNGQLNILPVKGMPIITTWSLIWLKGKKHAPAAVAYLSFLEKEREKIIHEKFDWYENY